MKITVAHGTKVQINVYNALLVRSTASYSDWPT